MARPTLFGDEAEPKPRTPPPEWVRRKLLALGVSAERVATYDNRQAFAVLRSKSEDREADGNPPEPPREPDGASGPERAQVAADLDAALADATLPDTRLCDVICAALYCCTRAELARAGRGFVRMLREVVARPEDASRG